MPGFPAARKGDPITHDMLIPSGVIGPPITGPCPPPMYPVMIEGLPAAHVNCTVVCTGAVTGGLVHPPPPGPPPPIIKGSPTVLIHNMPAARWVMSGDVGACTVQLGDPKLIAMRTTLIGEFGTPNIAGLPVVQLPDGSIQVGDAIVIKGDPLFQAKTMAALNQIGQTSTGDKLLNSIDDAGKKVTIQSTAGGNACGYPKATAADRFAGADGKPGKGTDANVFFNSDDDTIGSEEWETRPPAIGLAHELVHAEQATYGSMKRGDADNDSRPDPSDPSQSSQAPIRELEAAGIPPHDKGDFNENKIRSEWNPEQPEREWY